MIFRSRLVSYHLKNDIIKVGDSMHLVFGGSFNPPTIAHLNIVKKLLSTYKGARVLLLPVGDDYKKPELAPFYHRYLMLELLIKKIDHASVLDIESRREYKGTLASLKEINKMYNDLYFVIGSDQLKDFKTWINYEELLESYPFIVMTREGSISKEEFDIMFRDIKHNFTYLSFNENISSSNIRKSLKKHSGHLTPEVYQYILKNHLYEEPNHV